MTSARRLLLLAMASATLLPLSGCATLGPAYTPDSNAPKDQATVYVYRQPGFVGGAVAYTVSANGKEVSTLPSGGYFVYHSPPGEVEFSAKTEAHTSVTVDAKAGEVYYVKGTVGVGVFVGHPHLVLVEKDVGEKEIVACKLAPPRT
jgi:predicted small lipoprotein YifL